MPRAEVEEVSVVRLHADGRTGEAVSYLGLISPSPRSVTIPIPAAGPFLAGPLQPDRPGGPGAASLRLQVEGDRVAPEAVQLRPNGMEFLRVDHRVALDLSGVVELKAGEGGAARSSWGRAPAGRSPSRAGSSASSSGEDR